MTTFTRITPRRRIFVYPNTYIRHRLWHYCRFDGPKGYVRMWWIGPVFVLITTDDEIK